MCDDNTPTRAYREEVFKTAMQEDRTEIRELKNKLFNLCTFIPVSSFAVTAFLLGTDNPQPPHCTLAIAVEIAFMAILWLLFLRLRGDLLFARKCLEDREDNIVKLIRDAHAQPVPFHDPQACASEQKTDDGARESTSNVLIMIWESFGGSIKVRIRERDCFWLAGAASGAMLLKAGFVVYLLLRHNPLLHQ